MEAMPVSGSMKRWIPDTDSIEDASRRGVSENEWKESMTLKLSLPTVIRDEETGLEISLRIVEPDQLSSADVGPGMTLVDVTGTVRSEAAFVGTLVVEEGTRRCFFDDLTIAPSVNPSSAIAVLKQATAKCGFTLLEPLNEKKPITP